jgi:ADP-heptose:LPS heptosyltransferase
MNFKISGDLGDVIYSLPIMRYYGGGDLYLNYNYLPTIIGITHAPPRGLKEEHSRLLYRLLIKQDYVESVKVYNNENIDVNMDLFRERCNYFFGKGNIKKEGNLCKCILTSVGVPFGESDKPWLYAEAKHVANVVFNRSFRWKDKKFNYSKYIDKYRDSCVFVGFLEEWHEFCKDFGNIEYYKIKDFWDLACVIKGASLFIGNQSAAMSIAIGLGKRHIQEKHPTQPDCVFNSRNKIKLN